MTIQNIDHVAIPIQAVDEMLSFYSQLGFRIDRTDAPRLYAVALQNQKLNFHAPVLWQNAAFKLRAANAVPGSADLCFVWTSSMDELTTTLISLAVEVELGPVDRVGGAGGGSSVYFRDPDGNLIELITYSN